MAIINSQIQLLGGDHYLVFDAHEELASDAMQVSIQSQVDKYQALYDWDYEYCVSVQGAALENNLWVVRNRDNVGFTENDLQAYKNIVWNEFIVKRLAPSRTGNLNEFNRSILQTIRDLNLQWHNYEVKGLHPKVESAERQIVLFCIQQKLIRPIADIDQIALRFRRSKNLSKIFANAVGCRVCAITGRTPGLNKTVYNIDMDYFYKQEGLFHFTEAVKQFGIPSEPAYDYVAQLSRLMIISTNHGLPLDNIELAPLNDGQGQTIRMPPIIINQPAPPVQAPNPPARVHIHAPVRVNVPVPPAPPAPPAPIPPQPQPVLPPNHFPVPNGSSILGPNHVAFPPGTTVLPPNTFPVPNGSSILGPNHVAFPPGTTILPPNHVAFPPGTAVLPPNHVAYPSGTAILPAGAAILPAGHVAVPNNFPALLPAAAPAAAPASAAATGAQIDTLTQHVQHLDLVISNMRTEQQLMQVTLTQIMQTLNTQVPHVPGVAGRAQAPAAPGAGPIPVAPLPAAAGRGRAPVLPGAVLPPAAAGPMPGMLPVGPMPRVLPAGRAVAVPVPPPAGRGAAAPANQPPAPQIPPVLDNVQNIFSDSNEDFLPEARNNVAAAVIPMPPAIGPINDPIQGPNRPL